MAEATPIKRIRTSNGDAQIHIDALVDDNGLTLEEYIDEKIAEINIPETDFSNYYSKKDVDTFFKKQYHYADPYINISSTAFGLYLADGYTGSEQNTLWEPTINTDMANMNENFPNEGTLVIPYDLYDVYWTNDYNPTQLMSDKIKVTGSIMITKVVIPRGFSFYAPYSENNEDIGNEGLIELFPYLQTIVRIHDDGAVLSYNIITGDIN